MAHNKHAEAYKKHKPQWNPFVEARFTVNICTKTAKMMGTRNFLQNHIKNAKTTKFLSQSAFYTFKGPPAKFYLSAAFG